MQTLGARKHDGELTIHGASIPPGDAEAARAAEILFEWARPFLHVRRRHALRVVLHAPTSRRAWRFGLDVVQGWQRRDEVLREVDQLAGPLPASEPGAFDEHDARAAAEAWLALVDASAYDEALDAAPRLTSRGARSSLIAYLRAVPATQEPRRAPFSLQAARLGDLPGGPFVLFTYLTPTARGALLETLVLERGQEGLRVASYEAQELTLGDLGTDAWFL